LQYTLFSVLELGNISQKRLILEKPNIKGKMFKILSILFSSSVMTGIVDQVNGQHVFVELTAKDGHAHEMNLPKWLFPCKVSEGTKFTIRMSKSTTAIMCEGK